MIRTLMIRGLIAGLAGGLLAFAFASLFGEPAVSAAIALEAAHSHAAEEPELFSRGVQSTAGLLTATTTVGLALGGLMALLFASMYGRVVPFGARTTAMLIAGGGVLVFVIVPLTKYPANPPAVGSHETIGERTTLYFGLILIAVVALIAAVRVARRRATDWGPWNATIAGAALFVALVGLAELLLPAVNEVPGGFPAATLWQFRLASAGTQLVLWSAIGLAFGWSAERAINPEGAMRRRTKLAAA